MSINAKVALMTLAEFKAFLAESSADDFITDTTYNAKLEGIIDAVGQWFNTYTDRILVEAEHTEFYDGDGKSTIALPQFPIISTASEIAIYLDSGRVYGADTKVAAADLMIYPSQGVVRVEGAVFPESPQSVKAVYTAGYEIAADDGVLLPEDLKFAALLTGGMLWKIEKEKLYKMASVTIAGGSATYNVDEAMPKSAGEVLELYVAENRAGVRW